jgi:hypothetical protein
MKAICEKAEQILNLKSNSKEHANILVLKIFFNHT